MRQKKHCLGTSRNNFTKGNKGDLEFLTFTAQVKKSHENNTGSMKSVITKLKTFIAENGWHFIPSSCILTCFLVEQHFYVCSFILSISRAATFSRPVVFFTVVVFVCVKRKPKRSQCISIVAGIHLSLTFDFFHLFLRSQGKKHPTLSIANGTSKCRHDTHTKDTTTT